MPPHNIVALTRPRSLANVLLDLKEARSDWEQASADADCACREGNPKLEDQAQDRATEADTRVDDLREEFASRFLDATGLTWKQVEEAVSEAVL